MTGPYGAPSQSGPQGPHGGPPPGMGSGGMGPGPQQGWAPGGPGPGGPGPGGPGQGGPGQSGLGQSGGQHGPGPQGYGGAPSAPKKPLELDKILGFVAAGAAVLAFLLNFLDYTPGFTFGALLLIGGLLSIAPLLPKAGEHTFLAAVIPVSLFLGLLFGVFQGAGYAEVGFWLIFVLALVQAAAAVGVYLIKAGIIKPGAARPSGPPAGYGQGPGSQGPGQQGPGQQGSGPQGSGQPNQYGPPPGFSGPGNSGPGNPGPGNSGAGAPSGYGAAAPYGSPQGFGQQGPDSTGPDTGATNLTKSSGSSDRSVSEAGQSGDDDRYAPPAFSGGFADAASSFAPTQQVNYSQMREEAERAGQSGTHGAPSGYGSASDSDATTYGSPPAGYGSAAPAGSGSQTGPVPTQETGAQDSDGNPGTGPQQVPPGYQSGPQH